MTIAIIALIWLAACAVFTPIACAFFHAAGLADQRESEGCGEGEGEKSGHRREVQ